MGKSYELIGYEYRCTVNGSEVMKTTDCGQFLLHAAKLLGGKVVAFQRREVRGYECAPTTRYMPWENITAEEILSALER